MKTANKWRWVSCAMFFALVLSSVQSIGKADEAAKDEELKVDEASAATSDETLEHVPTILKIEYAIEKTNPPNLLVTAYGQVPTLGWTKVQLLRRIYVTPPADGIWEYDLLALRPTGIVPQVLTTVKASNKWKDYDASIKGIRVYGIDKGVKEVSFKK